MKCVELTLVVNYYDFIHLPTTFFSFFASCTKNAYFCFMLSLTCQGPIHCQNRSFFLHFPISTQNKKTHVEQTYLILIFPSLFCISCLLLDHYNESNDKSFVCALCLRRYSKLSCLKRHVRYECTKNPNRMSFKCPYCNHMSKRRDSLTQHILSLHQSRKSH